MSDIYRDAFNTILSVFADKLVIDRSDNAASANARKLLGRLVNINKAKKPTTTG